MRRCRSRKTSPSLISMSMSSDSITPPVSIATFQLTTSVPHGTETDDASTGTHSVLDGVGNAAQAGPVSGARVDHYHLVGLRGLFHHVGE